MLRARLSPVTRLSLHWGLSALLPVDQRPHAGPGARPLPQVGSVSGVRSCSSGAAGCWGPEAAIHGKCWPWLCRLASLLPLPRALWRVRRLCLPTGAASRGSRGLTAARARGTLPAVQGVRGGARVVACVPRIRPQTATAVAGACGCCAAQPQPHGTDTNWLLMLMLPHMPCCLVSVVLVPRRRPRRSTCRTTRRSRGWTA